MLPSSRAPFSCPAMTSPVLEDLQGLRLETGGSYTTWFLFLCRLLILSRANTSSLAHCRSSLNKPPFQTLPLPPFHPTRKCPGGLSQLQPPTGLFPPPGGAWLGDGLQLLARLNPEFVFLSCLFQAHLAWAETVQESCARKSRASPIVGQT